MSHAHILGDLKTQPRIGRTEDYITQRDCTVDCRQPDFIEIHPTVELGLNVKFYVQSHDTRPGHFGDIVSRPLKVCEGVWIASDCILYNCVIGKGSILAVGSVVRSHVVPPGVMVAGNPARIIRKLSDNGEWMEWDAALEKIH